MQVYLLDKNSKIALFTKSMKLISADVLSRVYSSKKGSREKKWNKIVDSLCKRNLGFMCSQDG